MFDEARATMEYLPVLHTAEERRRHFSEQLNEHASLIAVQAGVIVGFALFGRGWLHHLYVSRRNHGVGAALLEAVQARSKEGLQLWTFQANQGAQRFYQRHGFIAVEQTEGDGNEERLPDVRYEWRAVGSR